MNRTYRAKCWFAGAFAIGVSSLGLSSTADAQWAPDRSYTEGPGIRVGNVELHPGVAVRAGYDSNVFRTKNDSIGAGIIAVSPHLHLTTLKQQRASQGEDAAGAEGQLPPPVAFDLGLAGTFFQYTKDGAPSNVEADTNANLSVLPERTFGFDVGAAYARNTRPFTQAGGNPGFFSSKYAFDRITPSLLLRGQSRGAVLKGSVGYAPAVLVYENTAQFSYLNAVTHSIPLAASWKFLPYTALLYDGGVGYQQYLKDRPTAASGASIFLSDATRFHSRVGINGAVTTRLSLRGLVGYALINNSERLLSDREDVVGEAAATFAWAPGSNAEIGYLRSLDVSPLGGYMQQDRGYAKTTLLFAQAFQLAFDFGAAHVNYGRMLDANGDPLGSGGTTKRSDVRVDGGVHGEYRATSWLAFMADFTVLANITDFAFDRATATPFPAQFITLQGYGGARFHY
jgi:hypothetical protein